METKDEVNKDPSLKTKTERDRYLREKNAINTRKFIEERKTLAQKQDKRREKLKKQHEVQLNELDKYVKNVSISIDWTQCRKMKNLLSPKKYSVILTT